MITEKIMELRAKELDISVGASEVQERINEIKKDYGEDFASRLAQQNIRYEQWQEALKKESPASLFDRFGDALSHLTGDGISIRQVVRQSLVTPSCALLSLSHDGVEYVYNLLTELSSRARRKYGS